MKTTRNSSIALAAAAVVAIALSGAAFAEGKNHDQMKAEPMKGMAMADADMTNAEVRKVDKEAKKVTLKHEAIKNLDMPGMTMVFTAKDKSMLANLKPGDKVKFVAASEGGKLVVTEIQAAP